MARKQSQAPHQRADPIQMGGGGGGGGTVPRDSGGCFRTERGRLQPLTLGRGIAGGPEFVSLARACGDIPM